LAGNDAITVLHGKAHFINSKTLKVVLNDGGKQSVHFDKAFIGTGAQPATPPITGLKDTPYLTSTSALELTSTPAKLVVIGTGFVALELAQAFARLGTDVTILARSRLLSGEDPAIGETVEKAFAQEGITIYKETEASRISHDGQHFTVELATQTLQADQLLIATGRSANIETLALDKIGVETARGFITVNQRGETSAANIYAAGDCTNNPEFVYVAAALGSRAAVNMTGGNAKLDLSAMPAVMFTEPQVATVGLRDRKSVV